jgi:hypothetical protein
VSAETLRQLLSGETARAGQESDGIGGGQIQAVARCRREFEALVQKLLERREVTRSG